MLEDLLCWLDGGVSGRSALRSSSRRLSACTERRRGAGGRGRLGAPRASGQVPDQNGSSRMPVAARAMMKQCLLPLVELIGQREWRDDGKGERIRQ